MTISPTTNEAAKMDTPSLPLFQCVPDLEKLRARLHSHGWQTRAQLSDFFGWPDRYIRELAEQLGPEIIRGQKGFKLTADLTRDDLHIAQQASDAFISQGKRMLRYGLALRRKIHQFLK